MEKEGLLFSPPATIMEDESVGVPYHYVIHISMMSLALQEVTEDLTGDPEENSSHYMAILIEALSILGKVQEALDVCMYMYSTC